MTLSKLLKKLVEAGTLTEENVAEINDSVTDLIKQKAKPFEEQINTLTGELSAFKDKALSDELSELGYSEKQIKLLNKLMVLEDGESVKDGAHRVGTEYDINPQVKSVKQIDDHKIPKQEPLFGSNDVDKEEVKELPKSDDLLVFGD